jgi:hypothetical protein
MESGQLPQQAVAHEFAIVLLEQLKLRHVEMVCAILQERASPDERDWRPLLASDEIQHVLAYDLRCRRAWFRA